MLVLLCHNRFEIIMQKLQTTQITNCLKKQQPNFNLLIFSKQTYEHTKNNMLKHPKLITGLNAYIEVIRSA